MQFLKVPQQLKSRSRIYYVISIQNIMLSTDFFSISRKINNFFLVIIMHRYTSTHDSLPGAPPPLYHHMHSHHQRHSNVPHHHRPHCLMPSERDTAMMDEAYALYGYHDMVRVDRPPPYAVAVRSSRQCPAAAAAASSTATSADTSARPPSGSGSSNR